MDDLSDLEIDVQGVPIPAWLASRPDHVYTVTFSDADGNDTFRVTFEQFGLFSLTMHCTHPRHSSWLSQPDPDCECHWTHPIFDEAALMEHAWTHVPNPSPASS